MAGKREYDDATPEAFYRDAKNSGALGAAFKWGCVIVGVLVLLSVCGGVYGFANNWFQTGVKIISPENVVKQYEAGYHDYNALKAVAQNICSLEKSRDGFPKGSEAYIQRDSQVQAQEQNYQRISRNYDAYMANMFEAKHVKPNDLPSTAPTVVQMKTLVCT